MTNGEPIIGVTVPHSSPALLPAAIVLQSVYTKMDQTGVYPIGMRRTIHWILVTAAACVVCSAVTYPIAHRRGYDGGYKVGFFTGLRNGLFGKTVTDVAALQQLRAGDISGATRFLETSCFASARTYFRSPTPSPGEASGWGSAQGLDLCPDTNAATALAKGLWQYRAAYRTNSADWDDAERTLEIQLANVKSGNNKAWSSILVTSMDNAANTAQAIRQAAPQVYWRAAN